MSLHLLPAMHYCISSSRVRLSWLIKILTRINIIQCWRQWSQAVWTMIVTVQCTGHSFLSSHDCSSGLQGPANIDTFVDSLPVLRHENGSRMVSHHLHWCPEIFLKNQVKNFSIFQSHHYTTYHKRFEEIFIFIEKYLKYWEFVQK